MPLSTIDNTGLSQSQILSAINMPTGSVVQVVQGVSTTGNISTTSSSFVSSSFTTTITPQFSTSKILILFTGGFATYGSAPNTGNVSMRASINGGSYNSITGNTNDMQMIVSAPGTNTVGFQWSWSYLYSPSTTNSVAITPYFNSTATGNTQFYLNFSGTSGTALQTTLLEIR